MNNVVILVPVLRRPRNVRPLLASIAQNTPLPHRVLFICSPDDEMEIHKIRQTGSDYLVLDRNYEGKGDYARKINAGYFYSEEPLLFLGADDLEFYPDWFETAQKKLRKKGIGVVGTNDLGNPSVLAGEHATHSLVTRDYIDQFGTVDQPKLVLSEYYPHEFVDNEFVETAKMRNAWAFAEDSIVRHLHPDWGLGQMDDLYAQSAWRMARGKQIYEKRKILWQR